ncbi:MAG: hypothetical protein Q9190_006669, partial [Brigantiaea leucoxantha]
MPFQTALPRADGKILILLPITAQCDLEILTSIFNHEAEGLGLPPPLSEKALRLADKDRVDASSITSTSCIWIQMEKWKTQGYVADSDEDDEVAGYETPPISVQHTATHESNDSYGFNEPDPEHDGKIVQFHDLWAQPGNIRKSDKQEEEPNPNPAEEDEASSKHGPEFVQPVEISVPTYENTSELKQHDASIDFSEGRDELPSENDQLQITKLDNERPESRDCGSPQSPPTKDDLGPGMDILLSSPSTFSSLSPGRSSLSTLENEVLAMDVRPLNLETNSDQNTPDWTYLLSQQPFVKDTVGRTLRTRNPIQLHPYALEGQKYRQTLQARGVRPLRIARGESQHVQNAHDDSQEMCYAFDHESQQSSRSEIQTLPSSPPSLGVQDPSLVSPGNRLDYEAGELPDMHSLLSSIPSNLEPRPRKRRKVSYVSRRKDGQDLTGHHRPIFVRPDRYLPSAKDGLAAFDAPPSPSLSGSATSPDRSRPSSEGVQSSAGGLVVALPTPVTSSEPRRLRNNKLSPVEISDDALSEQSSESISFPKAEKEDLQARQLERVQRRIRGVLPASWLKLDLKSRARKPPDIVMSHRSRSPEEVTVQKGVARPIVSSMYPKVTSQSLFMESSDESDSNGMTREPRRIDSLQRHAADRFGFDPDAGTNDQVLPEFIYGEADEDNEVDAMLPSAQRRRTVPGKKQRRSTKLVNGVSRLDRRSIHRSSIYSRGNPTHQPRITDRFGKAKIFQQSFQPPKLGVLDGPSLRADASKSMPSFLRVAARTARLRNDKGRHSPSRKYLYLHTSTDTADTNETLEAWQEGTLTPRATLISRRLRVPLESCSTNPQVLPFSAKHSARSILTRTLSNPTGLRTKRLRTKSLQTTFTDPVQDTSPTRRKTQETRTKHPESVGQIPAIDKRGFIVSTINATEHGPALLETLQTVNDYRHPQAAFRRQLIRANRNESSNNTGPLLKGFLSSPEVPNRSSKERTAIQTARKLDHPGRVSARRIRKRQPKRLRAQIIPGQSAQVDPVIDPVVTETTATGQPNKSIPAQALVGLGPFGTSYTETFGISPFPTGTYFHQCTFLGGGNFSKSLQASDLDEPRGFSSFTFQQTTFKWGSWNDSVSEEMGRLVDCACEGLHKWPTTNFSQANALTYSDPLSIFDTIFQYVSSHLSFLDPIDRISFLQRCKSLITKSLQELDEGLIIPTANSTPDHDVDRIRGHSVQAMTYCLATAGCLRSISVHQSVPPSITNEMSVFVEVVSQRLLTSAANAGFGKLSECFETFKRAGSCGNGIELNHAYPQAFIVSKIVTERSGLSSVFWNIVQRAVMPSLHSAFNRVPVLEDNWQKLFTLLPFLEFDGYGVLEPGRRFKSSISNWSYVKQLFIPVLKVYGASPVGQHPTFNSYYRALFGRCLHLIRVWGWHTCESIIGTLFDFFARNALANLKNEEARGSPIFLQQLTNDLVLDVVPEDCCFHILLKIIGMGLKAMRKYYDNKKIRDVAWRLMPNHGRLLPKDQPIRQEDLDALRNHHDLLCTLYWASPPGYRPKISAIQSLVDLESSHREACHISIRAWSNLVHFQLSIAEPLIALEPFTGWFRELLRQIISQHGAARAEVEEQARLVEGVNGRTISHALCESTIARNQRQVVAMLSDALVSLKNALDSPCSKEAARVLCVPDLASVFNLFNDKAQQANEAIQQALSIVLAFGQRSVRDEHQQSAGKSGDDSQDYGDWSAFDDTVATEPLSDIVAVHLETHFQEPIKQLWSNCFGADTAPEDVLLTEVIQARVMVASILVHNSSRSWSDYLSQYGAEAWSSLRDTEQARKYGCYYFASLIDFDRSSYKSNRAVFLTTWLNSLVERESLIKYQHRLTSALLNADPINPVLNNLPFYPKGERYEISSSEFLVRRICLISCVLSNIREAIELDWTSGNFQTSSPRVDYKDMLRSFMNTMKHNYQELGQGDNVRGAYVQFIQQVVELIQQHTSTICPVDRFFTDSSAFPLPATDPTYVVGQLKNYGLRLRDSKAQKQLAVFVQSVSERAAIDGQQEYLVGQLHTAISDTFCHASGSADGKPSLAVFLIRAIFPAYIKLAFSHASGWLLALPILQATRNAFRGLLLEVNGADTESVTALESTISRFLHDMHASLHPLLTDDQSHLLEQPQTLQTLAACYSVITAAMPILDYLSTLLLHQSASTQKTRSHTNNQQLITFFQNLAISIANRLLNHDDSSSSSPPLLSLPSLDHSSCHYQDTFAGIRSFASKELRDSLGRNWSFSSATGTWFVQRGSMKREVVVD